MRNSENAKRDIDIVDLVSISTADDLGDQYLPDNVFITPMAGLPMANIQYKAVRNSIATEHIAGSICVLPTDFFFLKLINIFLRKV